MTRTVDDMIDIAIGILMTAIMLAMGAWCTMYLKNLYSQPVLEKTAPTVELQERAPEYVYTGRDCLLQMVINDEFCPSPNKVVFAYEGETRTITYDNDWFNNKEDKLNTMWGEFFYDAVAADHVTTTLVFKSDKVTPDHWFVEMEVTTP